MSNNARWRKVVSADPRSRALPPPPSRRARIPDPMTSFVSSRARLSETPTGRGEACPYPECPHDPAGGLHGTWHGVQCRELRAWRSGSRRTTYRRVTNHIPEWGLPGHLPESLCLFEMLEEPTPDGTSSRESFRPALAASRTSVRSTSRTTSSPGRSQMGQPEELIEFEVDGNQPPGLHPEGLPKDAEWCGDCWSTCPSYDPSGSHDCNSCLGPRTQIGTSYENNSLWQGAPTSPTSRVPVGDLQGGVRAARWRRRPSCSSRSSP